MQAAHALMHWRDARVALLAARQRGASGRELALAECRDRVAWGNFYVVSTPCLKGLIRRGMGKGATHHRANAAAREEIIDSVLDSVHQSVSRLEAMDVRDAVAWLRTICWRRAVDWRRKEERRRKRERVLAERRPTARSIESPPDPSEWWRTHQEGVARAADLYRDLIDAGRDGPHHDKILQLQTTKQHADFDAQLQVLEWRHVHGLSAEQIYGQPGMDWHRRRADTPERRQGKVDQWAARGRKAVFLGAWVGLDSEPSRQDSRLLWPVHDYLRPRSWTLAPSSTAPFERQDDGDEE